MNPPTSLERRLCGCIYSITWGTDGETLLHACAEHNENLVGLVAVCSRGRPGLVTGRKQLPWGLSWVGIGLDDGSAWSSRSPRKMTQDELVALSESKAAPEFRRQAVTPPEASGAEVFDGEQDDSPS